MSSWQEGMMRCRAVLIRTGPGNNWFLWDPPRYLRTVKLHRISITFHLGIKFHDEFQQKLIASHSNHNTVLKYSGTWESKSPSSVTFHSHVYLKDVPYAFPLLSFLLPSILSVPGRMTWLRILLLHGGRGCWQRDGWLDHDSHLRLSTHWLRKNS